MSTTVWESYHLRAPIDRVWALVRPATFEYLKTVVSAETKAPLGEVGSFRSVAYKDGTVQKIRITGISDADTSISWELEESLPATTFTAQNHAVRLRRVTDGNTTFIEWTTEFSSDASTAVLQDAKFKQADNFAALAVALGIAPTQPKLTLTYFPLQGRAEVARLILHQAGLAFDDVRLPFSEWPAKKTSGFAPFGQLPVLTAEGKNFAQSAAIERYLARLGGLAGDNALEAAEIDSLVMALADFAPKFIAAVSPFENKTEDEKKPKVAAWLAGDFVKWMPFFNKALLANKAGAGFIVGNKISHIDVAFWAFLSILKVHKADALGAYPALEAWYGRVGALPRIAAYIKTRPATVYPNF